MLVEETTQQDSLIAKVTRKENWIEISAKKIATWIQEKNDVGEVEYLTMKLGLEMIIINLTKGLMVYGIAILVNLLIPTLIVHGSYFVLRRVSFGLHAKSSLNCTIISVIFFVVIPYFMKDITVNNYLVFGFFLVYISCCYFYAPADTEKNPLIGKERRELFRRKSVITCICLMFSAVIIPNPMIKTLITVGVALQIVQILPVTYKILKRGYANYENYEEESI